MLSIICPFRLRGDYILDDFIDYYHKLFPDAEIVVVIQNDNDLFLKGQLCNVGFQNSKGDVLTFIDVDTRIFGRADFENIAYEHDCPVIPFTDILKADCLGLGVYELHDEVISTNPPGGIYIYRRNDFEAINGHSNLYRGHTGHDKDLVWRGRPIWLDGVAYHLEHPIDNIKYKTSIRNNRIYETRETRDIQQDGIKQMRFDFDRVDEWNSFTKFLFVSNFTVSDDFIYKDILNSD